MSDHGSPMRGGRSAVPDPSWNATDAPLPQHKTLARLFEEQVGRTPNSTAVIFEGERMTYARLNEKADRAAAHLRDRGVGPNQIAAIMVERSFEMMIGILGILKAGAAYLPIDPKLPKERIDYMLKDSGAAILLTTEHTEGTEKKSYEELSLHSVFSVSSVVKNHEGEGPSHLQHLHLPLKRGTPGIPSFGGVPEGRGGSNLAYVIYTSGSTGRPKGVMIDQRAVVNRLHWMQQRYPLGQEDVILQKTPYFFDVSVWELFWWFFAGAALCFLRPGFEKFPQAIVEAVEKSRVTVMHFVPSMFNAFLHYIEGSEDVQRLHSLKRIFASGETLGPAHVAASNRTLGRENSTRLTNLYGPTEATVDVSFFDCPAGRDIDPVPIGKPIDNIGLHILDEELQELPAGAEGELCISGVGLARGYLNNPELTAEKFIAVGAQNLVPLQSSTTPTQRYPLLGGVPEGRGGFGRPRGVAPTNCKLTTDNYKLYKTGDLAFRLADGNIVFKGRMDNQVKIRGLRIELGEIEAVLSAHPAVRDSVVKVRQSSETVVTLAAYCVLTGQLSADELKGYAQRLLPDYMVPAEYIFLAALPLTPSGKKDRKVLT